MTSNVGTKNSPIDAAPRTTSPASKIVAARRTVRVLTTNETAVTRTGTSRIMSTPHPWDWMSVVVAADVSPVTAFVVEDMPVGRKTNPTTVNRAITTAAVFHGFERKTFGLADPSGVIRRPYPTRSCGWRKLQRVGELSTGYLVRRRQRSQSEDACAVGQHHMGRLRIRTLLGAAGLIVVAACSSNADAGSDATEASVPPAELIATGEQLYQANCASCHGADLRGTDEGPSHLSIVYEPGHHGDFAFQLAVSDGVRQHHWPFGDMAPVPGLSTEDVDAIVAFVREQQRVQGFEPYEP